MSAKAHIFETRLCVYFEGRDVVVPVLLYAACFQAASGWTWLFKGQQMNENTPGNISAIT